MKTITQTNVYKSLFTIGSMVLISTWMLFALDKDTHQFSDLLKPGNLAALVVYFTPTFLICLLLFQIISKKFTNRKSIIVSLTLGIPISFFGIIYLLS